jgi:hypothetical protein
VAKIAFFITLLPQGIRKLIERAIICVGSFKPSTGEEMTDGLKDIIKKLEHQRIAIERALAALREVDGSTVETPAAAPAVSAPATRKGRRKGGMTPEGRRRLSEALRKRWAAKRAGSVPSASATRPAKRKGGMTPEGRKRLSEALKKRWAVKRAASAVPGKRAGRKKSA